MEEDCDGLCWKYLIEEGGLRPELVISSEPTSLNVYRGQRGRMEMGVSFTGVSAHGSAPERGENAVYAAARACLKIEELHGRLADDAFLGKGSVAVTEIDLLGALAVRRPRPGAAAPGPAPDRGRDAGVGAGRGARPRWATPRASRSCTTMVRPTPV